MSLSEETRTYGIVEEKAVSLDGNYVVKMHGSGSGKVGILLSNSVCEVYAYNGPSLRKTYNFADKDDKICDIRGSPVDEHLVYTCSQNGCVQLWDHRKGKKCAQLYEENKDTREFIKPLNTFDISHDGKVISAGSELTQGDAYILFWDARKNNLLGGYWNSHTDDITQVKFSKSKGNELISGSIDGLVNVFDITEQSEDDALQYSLNIDCAVDKLNWLSDNEISCLTQNIDLQLWNTETADEIKTFTRDNIATSAGIATDDCYVIDAYGNNIDDMIFLAGSYAECTGLKMLKNISGKKLETKAHFDANKQIVRSSHYDFKNNLLMTGGEGGLLNIWKQSTAIEPSTNKKNRAMATSMKKLKIHKNKPY